jgi:hypothetical protein
MIKINQLNKIGELLNSEGPILSVYSVKKDYYLASHVSDGSGTIYYSVELNDFKKYLRSEITLKELYLLSADVLILNKFRDVETVHTKDDFVDRVQCGEFYFNKFSDDIANLSLAERILNQN